MKIVAITNPKANPEGRWYVAGNTAYPLNEGWYEGKFIGYFDVAEEHFEIYKKSLADLSGMTPERMLAQPVRNINKPFFPLIHWQPYHTLHTDWLRMLYQDFEQYPSVESGIRIGRLDMHGALKRLVGRLTKNGLLIIEG